MNLSIENAFIVFNYNTPLEIASLQGISLNIKEHDRISIIGNNANGKSTLLRMIAGQIQPTFGKLFLDREDITMMPAAERPMFYISAEHTENCQGDLSVIENITLGLLNTRNDRPFNKAVTKEREQEIHNYLNKYDFLDLKDVLLHLTGYISRAQRCALSLLIAAIKSPPILLVDDITSGLDPEISSRLITTLENITDDQNLTLLAVMENPRQAFDFFNRGLIISNGRIVLDVVGDSKKRLDFSKIFDSFDVIPNIKQFEKQKS